MSINAERLEQFVDALAQVIATDPAAHEVDMASTELPACGTPGCHAGLVMLALDRLGVKRLTDDYFYLDESLRLSGWLCGTSGRLLDWAAENSKLWGFPHGEWMFEYEGAFGQTTKRFPAAVIRDHWRGVLTRVKAAQLTEA